ARAAPGFSLHPVIEPVAGGGMIPVERDGPLRFHRNGLDRLVVLEEQMGLDVGGKDVSGHADGDGAAVGGEGLLNVLNGVGKEEAQRVNARLSRLERDGGGLVPGLRVLPFGLLQRGTVNHPVVEALEGIAALGEVTEKFGGAGATAGTTSSVGPWPLRRVT